jgi:hypothetical protein
MQFFALKQPALRSLPGQGVGHESQDVFCFENTAEFPVGTIKVILTCVACQAFQGSRSSRMAILQRGNRYYPQ